MSELLETYFHNAEEAATSWLEDISSIDTADNPDASMMQRFALKLLPELRDLRFKNLASLTQQVETYICDSEFELANQKVLEICFEAGVATQLIYLMPENAHRHTIAKLIDEVVAQAQKAQNNILTYVADVIPELPNEDDDFPLGDETLFE